MQAVELTRDFYDWAHALNESQVPHVGGVSRDRFEWLCDMAAHARVVVVDDQPAGFYIAMRPGCGYDSVNYGWFEQRYPSFLYVDRIAVDPVFHRRGIGRRLYEDLVGLALPTDRMITCEVNERPPNPQSMAFHTNLGFEVVGHLETENNAKCVAMMSREL